MGHKSNQNNIDNQLQEATEINLHEPNMFKVLLLNDDYTPMDFVVEVLKGFFDMDEDQATQVMLHVHTRGKGMCGIFSHEVAETKTALVNDYSRTHQHPLLCVLEMV